MDSPAHSIAATVARQQRGMVADGTVARLFAQALRDKRMGVGCKNNVARGQDFGQRGVRRYAVGGGRLRCSARRQR